jgi:hypothetical protein
LFFNAIEQKVLTEIEELRVSFERFVRLKNCSDESMIYRRVYQNESTKQKYKEIRLEAYRLKEESFSKVQKKNASSTFTKDATKKCQ